jgi:hypothetical protein
MQHVDGVGGSSADGFEREAEEVTGGRHAVDGGRVAVVEKQRVAGRDPAAPGVHHFDVPDRLAEVHHGLGGERHAARALVVHRHAGHVPVSVTGCSNTNRQAGE